MKIFHNSVVVILWMTKVMKNILKYCNILYVAALPKKINSNFEAKIFPMFEEKLAKLLVAIAKDIKFKSESPFFIPRHR